MRRVFAFVFFLLTANAYTTETPTVLVLGDSLSAGFGIDVDQSWTSLLQTRLQDQGYEHRVVNASISGDTTESGAARIDTALQSFAPALVVVELGANDGLRGVPVERIKHNLRQIVSSSRASGAAVVMLGIRLPPNYGARYRELFENVYRELADEMTVPWIEFFMEGVALNDELMQSDGFHPNAAAQPLLLGNAWPVIRAALAD